MNIIKSDPVSHRTLLIYNAILSIFILLIDYRLGPFIQFPLLFILPVIIASWYISKWWGLFYAILLPLVRFYFTIIWLVPWTTFESAINALIRISVLIILVYLTSRVASQTKKLEKEVKMLEGLLPICSSCKKIRDDKNVWQPIEAYIIGHSDVSFTHGICQDCMEKYYPNYVVPKK
jgi:K+-sensing histidine kinase KdpD